MKKRSKGLALFFFISAVNLLFPFLSNANLKEYTIGPQDVLTIEIWDNPDLSREATVSLKGTISFPLIGEIKVEGFTSEQLRQTLRDQLADGYLINPQVAVTIKEYNSKKIYVLGEVNKPGDYPFSKATTMVEIISMAGGLTQDAGQEAYILRTKPSSPDSSHNQSQDSQNQNENLPGTDQNSQDNNSSIEKWANDLTKSLDSDPLSANLLHTDIITINLNEFNQGVNLNYELQKNDTLYIPKAKFVYVIGEVRSPGRFKLEKEVNVLQIISMAGGLTQKAHGKKVKIVRTIKGKEQEISVTMSEIVLPDDIIKVQESFF